SPKLMVMSLRDHGYAKAPYLLAGGKKDMAGDEVGLVDADGNPDEAALAKIPEEARREAERPLVGGPPADGELEPVFDAEALVLHQLRRVRRAVPGRHRAHRPHHR